MNPFVTANGKPVAAQLPCSLEEFGLTNQMRRAAVSVSSNIAGGAAVVSQSFIGQRQGFLFETDFHNLYAAAEEQGKMLSGLRRSVLENA